MTELDPSRGVGPGLSIGELAVRTGVEPGTLRMWESRHGFPHPERLPSGHRRFRDSDVEGVRAVLDARRQGLSLGAAIERARTDSRDKRSFFAGLLRRWPDLRPFRLPRRTLVALSRAIEDECCARAAEPVIVGAFQRERYYRESEARWGELARTSRRTIVFADFRGTRRPTGRPIELPLAPQDPLRREWAVVCHGIDFSACLAGWELPAEHARGERLFETAWSVEPGVVREAARIGSALAGTHDGALATELSEMVERTPAPRAGEQAGALSALTSRMVAYVSAAADAGWRVGPGRHG